MDGYWQDLSFKALFLVVHHSIQCCSWRDISHDVIKLYNHFRIYAYAALCLKSKQKFLFHNQVSYKSKNVLKRRGKMIFYIILHISLYCITCIIYEIKSWFALPSFTFRYGAYHTILYTNAIIEYYLRGLILRWQTLDKAIN